jgi:linoleoyl-CoA desaturase
MTYASIGAETPSREIDPRSLPDTERLRLFGEALDDVRRRAEEKLGDDDVRHVKRLRAISIAAEIVGRGLIHLSFEPIGFGVGVLSLWLHKQLEAIEIGHTALHGAYDKLEGAEAFHSKTFRWDVPIDEESWRHGHNVKHHGNTNVAHRDPDIDFGPVRLTEQTPYAWHHRFQLPLTLFVLFPNFGALMNLHFTGLNDVYGPARDGHLDVLPDRSWRTIAEAHGRALRKYVPYYFVNYVFFPALAAPFFWKVLLGNWLAETLRDVYSAATIFCGHVGDDVASYPVGTRAAGRGAWYAMQVEASNDFEVSPLVGVLCGGLELQIEHHLFPKLPPHRLREIAPEVRAICERHGVRYRSASWGATLKRALGHIARLSLEPRGARAESGATA